MCCIKMPIYCFAAPRSNLRHYADFCTCLRRQHSANVYYGPVMSYVLLLLALGDGWLT